MHSEVPKREKGVGNATKAVAKDATLHLDLLRAYQDGSIFIHRNGSRSDSQLLDPAFLSQTQSDHVVRKPGAAKQACLKGLSMLAGSSVHGALALQRLDQEMVLAVPAPKT